MEEVRAATRAPALLAILGARLLLAQDATVWKIDRLCGRVESVQVIKARHQGGAVSEKKKDLSRVPIELYEAHEGVACCVASDLKSSTQSNRQGQFKLKPPSPGRYWLNLKWNGKDYHVNFNFERSELPETPCADQGIGLKEDGTANWWRTVTLD